MEETIQIHLQHALPLRGRHAGEGGVVMHAGVVDEDVDGVLLQQGGERLLYGSRIGHVEHDGIGTAACRADRLHHGICTGRLAAGMHPDMAAGLGQTAGDGGTEIAAGAGHERMALTGRGRGHCGKSSGL